MQRLSLYTAPAAEPLAASDLEIHSRLGTGAIAALGETNAANLFIAAIRQRCEAITRRQLIYATWDLILDGFPSGRVPIEIPLPPYNSVTSFTYTDMNGDTQTLTAADYRVISESGPKAQPACIIPAYGTSWPTALDDMAVVTLRYKCGYGLAGSAVPEAIKNWMLINIANLWENRESETVALGRVSQVSLPTLADGLLEDYRVFGW